MLRNTGRLAGATLAVGAIVLLTMLVFGLMAVFGVGLFQRETAEFRGKTAEIERTKADADYRIANYDKFFDLCASIQADEDTIATLEAELDTKPSADRREQINATLTAVRANRFASISEYNADAAKAGTAGQFRDSNLPPSIDKTQESTTCAAPQQ